MATTQDVLKSEAAITNGSNNDKPKDAPAPKTDTTNPATLEQNQQINDNKKRKRPKKKAKPAAGAEATSTIFNAMQRDVSIGLANCQPYQIMDVLNAAIKPNQTILYHTCMEVKHDLYNVFSRSFPAVRVEVFGSSIMGTAFKDSDFDFHIQLLPVNESAVSFPVRDAIKLLAPSRKFTKFVPIPSARIPILKCQHIRSGYNCDLNFSDSLGLFNSPILGSLLNFDERIYDLATILKYWMKIHDLSGSSKISNYALMWLLIFYLQTMKLPIIPPIKLFQMNVTPYHVNEMNLAFNNYMPNKTKNRQRQSELLLGFFEFYKDFDFESNIICPLHAKAFPKNNVVEEYPNEFIRYTEYLARHPERHGLRLNKTICIQDPFDICQTIPGLISKQTYKEFRGKLGIAAALYKRTMADRGESGILLQSLFDRKAFSEALPPIDKIKSTTGRSSSFIKILPIESELALARKFLLRERGLESVIRSAEIKNFWAKKVIDFLIDMFENIFCLQISMGQSEADEGTSDRISKSPKVDGQTDVHTNDLLRLLEITGVRDVFYGRKQQKTVTPKFIQEEMAASKLRMENNKLEINFKSLVKLEAAAQNSDFVSIEFQDLVGTKKNNFFKGFQSLFSSIVRHYLRGYFMDFQTTNDLGSNVEVLPLLNAAKKKPRRKLKKPNNEQTPEGAKVEVVKEAVQSTTPQSTEENKSTEADTKSTE